MTVTVHVRLAAVDGRKLRFEVEANDGMDIISRGSHERFVIDSVRFRKRVEEKVARQTRPGT
jgi:fluoroacetyl-CoA thioesterase